MSNLTKFTMTAAAVAALIASAPLAAQAQSNGVTNCDAPGGRQQAGAAIGAVIGGLAGSQISSNERALGAVVGAGAGAAAGSYIGCNQQRARANAQANGQAGGPYAGSGYRATSNLRVRSGPGTSYRQVGSLRAGQSFQASSSQGEWVQLSNGGWVSAHYVAAN
ncbi:MAG: SH3 domain-containing protein [Alphaproteobacteria bacterium]|nr:SH3 domain-containing protein [Alphaproteobacteria bacterium]